MRLIPIPALALLLPGAAAAADRQVYPSSFDKVRIQGPYEVRITTGRSPAATVSGDPRAIDGVEVRVDGTTLVVRSTLTRWEEQSGNAGGQPVTVTLATPALTGVNVIGQGQVTIDAMKGDRVDVAVTGSGAITVRAIAADAANATVLGNGTVTLGGRAGRVRLLANGPGVIDAGGLDAGELFVRLDGPGNTKARARFAATVVNTGLGQVAIAGTPKCTVKADAGGPVTCGGGR